MNIRPLTRNIALAAAACALVFVFASLLEKSPAFRSIIPDRAVMLKHAIRGRLLVDVMPASVLLVSQDKSLAPDAGESGKLRFFQLFAAALCFYIAGVLGNGALTGGLAAGAAILWAPADLEQALFTCLMLIAVGSGVRRWGRETRSNAALTGFLLGACFLVRSSAISFPFIWAAHELLFTRGRLKERSLRALILFLSALAMLLPWAALNYKVLGVPALFESGRAYCNIVTGVLGGVFTIEGNYRGMAGLQPGQSVYAWALDAIMRDPWSYAVSILRRLGYIFLLEPGLAAAAVAGAAFSLERKKIILPLLLAAGFALSHSLMAIEPRYFQPLWLLLGCAAVQPAARLFRGPGRAPFLEGFFLTACTAVFGLAVVTEAAVIRSLLWLREPEAVFAAAEKDPSADRYLLRYGAMSALHGGDTARLLYFTRAAAAAGQPEAAAVMATLRSGGVFPRLTGRWIESSDQYVIKALRQLELGRAAEAPATLAEAQARGNGIARGTAYGVDADTAERVRNANDFRRGAILEGLVYWPPEKRGELLNKLEKIMPLSADEALQKARFLLAEGKKTEALRTLDGARGQLKEAGQFYQAVDIYAGCGAGKMAAALFDSAVLPAPLRSGVKEFLSAALVSGRLAAALDKLARGPGGAAYTKAAGMILSDPVRAKCETLEAASAGAGGRGFTASAAAAELRAGLKDAAAASAECGFEVSGDAGEKALLALTIQDAGRPAEAARRLDILSAAEPRYIYDAGVAYLIACDIPAAEKRLKEYLGKFPGDGKAAAALRAMDGYAKTACGRRNK